MTLKRQLVINPDTLEIENVIVVDDDNPITLPGRELVDDDGLNAGPGDRWDPAERRAYRVERTIPVDDATFEALIPADVAAIKAKIQELEQAVADGDVDAVRFLLGGLPTFISDKKQAIEEAVLTRKGDANR